MKINSHQYQVHAHWGPRPETPEALAARFLDLLDRLSRINPVFGDWIWNENGEPVAFDEVRDRLTGAIAAGITRADDGDPTPIYGYRFFVVNSLDDQPRAMGVSVHAGSWDVSDHILNDVDLHTSRRVAPDPTLVTFPIFKAAVLALAETFDATWCSAYPDKIMEFWQRRVARFYRLAWISYIGPRFAPLITPPPTAIVERRPNGGLLMAATDETFTTSNPAHLAAANDILAAIAPLNALPWPPDAEPPKA